MTVETLFNVGECIQSYATGTHPLKYFFTYWYIERETLSLEELCLLIRETINE
jgi:hypothetical protein